MTNDDEYMQAVELADKDGLLVDAIALLNEADDYICNAAGASGNPSRKEHGYRLSERIRNFLMRDELPEIE